MTDTAIPRHPRRKLELLVLFRRANAPARRVDILDISESGFLIDSPIEMSVGERVWLSLPGLQSIPAKVARVDGLKTGCAFDQPIHEAVLRAKLEEASY